MRELKFRFYDKTDNSFIYDIDKLIRNTSIILSKILNGEDKLISCDQYTGFKDECGVEIYENDIVSDENGHTYLVSFRYASWCLIHEPTCGSEREGECKWDYIHNFVFMLNIIGNIHQTPN